MVKAHTGHLTLGKRLPIGGNVIFLDTTVKTAKDLIGKALAPTWDMVHAIKSGVIDEVTYTRDYFKKLDNMDSRVRDWLTDVSKNPEINGIVLACFDGKDVFCHRHMLQRYLVEKFNFVEGWEVTSGDVNSSLTPNGSILSISKSEHLSDMAIEEELKELITKGEVVIINEQYVKDICAKRGREIDMNTECCLERAMLNWLLLSDITNPKLKKGDKVVTYVDTTRLIDTMYHPDALGLHPANNDAIQLQDYVSSRAVWKPLIVERGQSIYNLVLNFGFNTKVTVNKSHENLDHAAIMDTIYNEVTQ